MFVTAGGYKGVAIGAVVKYVSPILKTEFIKRLVEVFPVLVVEVPRVLFLGICLVFHYCLWQVLLPKLGFHLDRGSVSQALVEPSLVPP